MTAFLFEERSEPYVQYGEVNTAEEDDVRRHDFPRSMLLSSRLSRKDVLFR